MNKNKLKISKQKLIRAFIIMLSCILAIGYKYGFKPDEIIGLSHGNFFIAIILIIIAYALKAIVMFIPMAALYLAVGALFSNIIAVTLVNLFGIFVCLTVGYINGRIIAGNRAEEFLQKHPKLKKLNDVETNDCILFSFLVRVFGFLPCDVVSVYCGIKKLPYIQYIIGAMLGMLPGLILIGIMGTNIDEPTSPGFIVPLLINLCISVLSVIFYNYMKKHRRKK